MCAPTKEHVILVVMDFRDFVDITSIDQKGKYESVVWLKVYYSLLHQGGVFHKIASNISLDILSLIPLQQPLNPFLKILRNFRFHILK